MLFGLISIIAVSGAFQARVIIRGKITEINSNTRLIETACVQKKRERCLAETSTLQRQWQRSLAEKSKQRLSLMSAVLGAVPTGVWLSEVRTTDEGAAVMLDGIAISYESISAFAGALRSIPIFTDIRLTNARTRQIGNIERVDFSLRLSTQSSSEQTALSGTQNASTIE